MGGPVFEKVYKIVMRIPKGRVLTYGLISNMLDGALSAQGVGWALKALPSAAEGDKYTSRTVPWHRVINAQGGTSTHKVGLPPDLQRTLLEGEGVKFNSEGRVDLKKFLWLDT